jgi:hypothetical protein
MAEIAVIKVKRDGNRFVDKEFYRGETMMDLADKDIFYTIKNILDLEELHILFHSDVYIKFEIPEKEHEGATFFLFEFPKNRKISLRS